MIQSPMLMGGDNIKPGSVEYTSPGTYSFTVPKYKKLVVELWGAGGSGAEAVALNGNDVGTDGGNTSFAGTQIAYGGKRGLGYYSGVRAAGAGGSYSNGDSGSAAGASGSTSGAGGASPNGGAGGAASTGVGNNGGYPGGGGGGGYYSSTMHGSGGGGGGYCIKTYTAGASGAPTKDQIITVVVGAGGTSGNAHSTYPDGGTGGNGRARISWS